MVNMTEMVKKTFYQYLTGFQLVMAILFFLLSTYGMPENEWETFVFIIVALVAAFVYGKDKSTAVDLKKIDLTPQQEYQIKSVVEWLLQLLGFAATIEKSTDSTVIADKIKALEDCTNEELKKEIERRLTVDG